MGIPKFFMWMKNKFPEHINKIYQKTSFTDEEIEIEVDNFMIDLNGLFHGSAQKIYEYGAFAPLPRLLGKKINRVGGLQKQVECFKDICQTIEKLVSIAKPKKRLILCIDGPAPIAKQAQQRKRRFRSALDRKENDKSFDSSSITPGTKWMDYLSKYIDWHIRKNMSENPIWQKLEIVFSNEKAVGEGEHKILNYVRMYGNPNESFCIHGADADLIMLSLGTHFPHFYILRDDMFDNREYYTIDIGGLREDMVDVLVWESKEEHKFISKNAINDFILMCFMVGNDFLPHIPAIEIIQDGIDTMIDVYKQTCSEYGHLTEYISDNEIRFVKSSLGAFLGTVSQYEKGILQDKLQRKDNFFPDPILERNATQNRDGTYTVDIKQYRKDYYSHNLQEIKSKRELCYSYLEGMQWVLSYYTRGVPNWKWSYPYHYAPFSYTLAKYISLFQFPVYGHTKPTTPFIQLLSVLPPKSADLIPSPLKNLLTDEKSPLKHYYPEEFGIDLSGKKQDWEGIVILPMVNYEVVEKEYFRLFPKIDPREIKRNILGKSFTYNYSPNVSFLFKSFYGDFDCKVQNKPIEI